MRHTSRKGSSRTRLAAVGVLALGLTLGLSACDEVFRVTDPDRVNTETLSSEAALAILVASAIGEFSIAYSGGRGPGSGGGDAFVSTTGTFTDELMGAGTFTGRTAMDRRDWLSVGLSGNTSDVAYRNLHQARRAALFAQRQLDEIEGTRGADWALMRAMEAYIYVSFGEFFCGAVPFTELDETGVPVEASLAPVSTSEMFTRAITRFDEAIGADGTLHMARLGKARAQLALGQVSAAASTVASVPTSYQYFIEHSTNSRRQNNGMEGLFDIGRYTQADIEGVNGLPFRSANDMRTPFILRGSDGDFGFDFTTLEYRSLKYPKKESSLVLADGVAARLIEAEAAMSTNFGASLTILNDLRADAQAIMESRIVGFANLEADFGAFGFVTQPALAPLTDPGTADARLDMIMSERAFWLYLTGHRQGDMRRLVVNYGRAVNSVYPTGTYMRERVGGVYGNDVLAPIDFEEANNPQFDHSQCTTNSF